MEKKLLIEVDPVETEVEGKPALGFDIKSLENAKIAGVKLYPNSSELARYRIMFLIAVVANAYVSSFILPQFGFIVACVAFMVIGVLISRAATSVGKDSFREWVGAAVWGALTNAVVMGIVQAFVASTRTSAWG